MRRLEVQKPTGSFVPLVLRVEGALGKKIGKAFKGPQPVAAILALLGKRVAPDRWPAWLTFNAGEVLDRVIHLEAPVFSATGADEDEFGDNPEGGKLVYQGKGRAVRVTPDGNTEEVKVAAKDAGKLTAYEGGIVLRDLTWIDTPPATFPVLDKLLAQAVDAYSGDLAPYEVREDGPAPAALPQAAAGSGSTFLGGSDRTGFYDMRVSREQPKLVWPPSSSDENGGSEEGGNPVVADGLIYAANTSFTARCSATDLQGKTVWKTELSKTRSWIIGSACVDRGVVYQATNQGLYALDAKSGQVRWVARLSTVHGSPLVVGDLVFMGSGEGLIGLSVANGRKKWKCAVKRDEGKQGVIAGTAYRDGILFFVAEGMLHAVELASSKQLWTAPAFSQAEPSVDESSVYTRSGRGLSAFDRATGKERWHQESIDLDFDNTVAVARDRVVVRDEGGRLFALEKAHGERLWEYGTRVPYGIGRASPIIAGDLVLCVLVDKEDNHTTSALHAVDLTTGKKIWSIGPRFPIGQDQTSSVQWRCTPCVHDGMIFVDADGLCAFR